MIMMYQLSGLVPQLRIACAPVRIASFAIDLICFAGLFLIWREWMPGQVLESVFPVLINLEELIVWVLYYDYYARFELG
jgi:hypothetical protein